MSMKKRNRTADPPIILAAITSDIKQLEQLVSEGASVEATDRAGRTGLHYAAINKDETVCSWLLKHNANPNAKDAQNYTPLHFAAQEYAVQVAEKLLAAGAEVDVFNDHGDTALSAAVFESRGRGEMIRLLLSAGADPDKKTKDGSSARDLAQMIANFDVKQFLPQPK